MRSPPVQGICELPVNLQHSILAESRQPLPLQLSSLPEYLHQAALHAAHPSITASGSVKVPYTWAHSQHTIPLREVLGTQTNLQSLDCSGAFAHARWGAPYPSSQNVSDAFLS